MAETWIIAAIPSSEDLSWKISSEKVPHMTLLFLGEQGRDAETEHRISSFLEHLVETGSINRFGLNVDQRGTLGEDEADVLFFSKSRTIGELEDLRSYLLTQQDIRKAYDSVDQFPTWTPHLTLGYPDKPAKEVDHPIGRVEFDRIAFWIEDSDGPTFRLPNPDMVGELSMSEEGELSMSEEVDDFLSSYVLKHNKKPDFNLEEEYSEFLDVLVDAIDSEELLHYGVKGMKWGVRRTDSQLARARGAKPSEDHKKVASYQARAKAGGVKTLSNKEMQAVVNRLNLEQNYKRLNPSTINRGLNTTKSVVGAVGTVSSVIALANSPAGQAAKKAIQKALKK